MNTREILRKKRDIIDDRRKLFDEIIQRINTRIEKTPVHITQLDYIIPEVIFGRPTFNMTECMTYVMRHFQEEGLRVDNMGHNTIRLYWEHLLFNTSTAAAPREPRPRVRFGGNSGHSVHMPGVRHIQRRLGLQ